VKNTYYSYGKLLLTGEYLVLDGALSLAIPTKKGQWLDVVPLEKTDVLQWKSIDYQGTTWFEHTFSISQILNNTTPNPKNIHETLAQVLKVASNLNPSFLDTNKGYGVTTRLEFPQDWGLGSSSTLLNNIAQWADISGQTLLQNTFGGSGYDIAAAQFKSPILYQIKKPETFTKRVQLPWDFTSELFFVHLNKKRNSQQAVSAYKASSIKNKEEIICQVSAITQELVSCASIEDFSKLLDQHEEIIANVLNHATVKEELFKDYPNTIKSLGAWGGDFILAIGNEQEKEYFRQKGYATILDFDQMKGY
jgi:mevalonate kinase